jgi:PAS domain S-box-containing protein
MKKEGSHPVLSRLPLGRVLVALGVVLVAINIAAAVWDVRTARERVERRAQRDFSNMTRLLAEQTAASLEAVDLVLRDAARVRSAQEMLAQAPRLRAELAHVPHVAGLLVFDAKGRLLARTDADGFEPAAFTLHREAGDGGIFISDPYPEGDDGRWRVLLSRRLGGAGGGALAAAIELDSFDGLYRMLDLGEGAFITLLTMEGAVVARVPDPQRSRGRRLAAPGMYGAVRREGAWQGWETSQILNEPVLLSASTVRGFPLLVVNGATERAVFAPWRDEAWLIFDRTLLTSAAMLALMALAAWGLARRERALAGSWRKYQSMIEHSSDALILSRPKAGGVLYASPAIGRVLGYTIDDLRGREVIDVIHPEYRDAALKAREELLGSPGKVAVDETKVLHKDGSYRWIELTRSNLLHEPSVGAVVMNFRDITERKEAETERLRLEQRLRQAEKLEAVGRLAGGIAHDFNNILGGILGYAEMLAESAPPGSPLKRYADNVLTGANRASDLVAQILSYSRSQRGRRAPVDLGRVVAETIELVRGSLPAGVRLEVALPAAPLHVVGDATQLHQVAMNLCTNAIHAMARSGRLSVSLEAVDETADRAFTHATLRSGSYARLVVQDDGSGMDAATVARIFEPFFTTKEVGQGTGLGLALVYGIVTDSGGAIDVASSPGRGSRFAIYLPRVEAPAAVKDSVAGPVARGNGERVLIVDDEDALVAVTSEVLRHLGYEPVGCADGAAALAAFAAADGGIDAVILDEVMPQLSGTELAQRLRRQQPDLPIVLVSGYTGPILAERALAAGITEILKKPVQSRDMAAALARALKRA